jgi:hypothetical protein
MLRKDQSRGRIRGKAAQQCALALLTNDSLCSPIARSHPKICEFISRPSVKWSDENFVSFSPLLEIFLWVVERQCKCLLPDMLETVLADQRTEKRVREKIQWHYIDFASISSIIHEFRLFAECEMPLSNICHCFPKGTIRSGSRRDELASPQING